MITGRSTRMEVLELLRRNHSKTAEAIAAELAITPNAVRQHLANLEREGLVVSKPMRQQRGRPTLQFALTDLGDTMFPKRYGQLATMVLTEIMEMEGPEAVDRIMRRIALRHSDTIEPEFEGLTFDQKIDHLVSWFERAGTLAERGSSETGEVVVTIHNCPFRNTALKFPQVCDLTPHMIARLTGRPVRRLTAIHNLDPFCSFAVQPPQPAAVAD